MVQENETIKAIEILMQEYASNEKSLADISLEFKRDVLSKLNHRKFTLINEDINVLFSHYKIAPYSEVVTSFKSLIETFKDAEQTVLNNPTPVSITTHTKVSLYNTEGQHVGQLTLNSLSTGKLIDGRYQLIEEIGFGGMAIVWKALDKIQEEALTSDDQRYVAIKFIDSGLDKDMFANTVREANRTRSLKHDNIISILTVGKTGELLFIVMELLQGKPLSKFIRENAEHSRVNGNLNSFILPYKLGMSLSRQIAQAISYAHQSNEHKKGILHLDLKPENIFYNPENGTIKVLDFGLARYASKEDDEKTVFKGVEGLTKSYASPEMLKRFEPEEGIDESQILEAGIEDDVYSLACIIYELFSGKKPYGTLNAKQAEEVKKTLVPLKFKKNQWQALAKALSFDRKKRTANVDIFLNEFINTPITSKKSFSFLLPMLIIASLLTGILFTFVLKYNSFFDFGLLREQLKQANLIEKEIIELELSSSYKISKNKIEATKSPEFKLKPDNSTEGQIQKASIPILKFWTIVNNENRKVIEINAKTHKAVENFKIGDRLRISFFINQKVYLILVYIDSHLNMMVEPLIDCCEANETYDFRNKKPMKIGEPIGMDKIRVLMSKNKIDKSWVRLNDFGEIDEKHIRNNLNKFKTKDERYFINGMLDLVISK